MFFCQLLGFFSLVLYLAFGAQRADFQSYIIAYSASFVLFVALAFTPKTERESRWMLWAGIALRVLLLFSIPNLSDDIWRFLWDGRLSAAGIHPFAQVPHYYVDNQALPPGLTEALYAKLNSPHWHTVYPPISQTVFWAAGLISQVCLSWGLGADAVDYIAIVFVKLPLLACDLGVLWLLTRLSYPTLPAHTSHPEPSNSPAQAAAPHSPLWMIWFFCPLVLLETIGNAHFEGMMLFFMLAALRAFQQNKNDAGAVYWACAFATKLTPLLFLPLLWAHLGWRKGLRAMFVFGATSLLLFLPLLDADVLHNMSSSIGLYFQKFQFNASLYYLIRALGFVLIGRETGWQFGPWLSLAVFSGVFLLAFLQHKKKLQLAESLLFASFLQLSFAAAVHPWYVVLPFGLGLLTRWRFAVLWAGLVSLSYSHYAMGRFLENMPLIATEYALLWLFVWAEAGGRLARSSHPTDPHK